MTASRSLRVHSTQKQCLWYVILTRGSSHDDLLTHAPREHPGLCEWSVCCILHATPHQLLYRCSRRYRLAQVFGQTFHQLHHRSGCDGGILQAPLLSDLGERSSCMTAQSCAAPGSDRMSLQDIAQALDPRAHLTTYQTQSGGEHRGKALAPSI